MAPILWVLLVGCDQVRDMVSAAVPALQVFEDSFEHIQCETPMRTPSARGCAITTLQCGDVVEGNSSAGQPNWGDEFYVSAFCTPERHNYDYGPETVYMLNVPADIQADVRLDSNCVDLDLVAVGWSDKDNCPTKAHSPRISECEMDTKRGGGRVRMTTVSRPQTYLLGVEGKEGVTGNFRLTVKCSTYR